MSLQTNAALFSRFGFTGTKGDLHERRVSIIRDSIFQAMQQAQAQLGDTADLASLMGTMDTFMTNVHTASNKLPKS